ncbi:hypothetical protein C3L33_08521, partial [Rhododendron williamsianum]
MTITSTIPTAVSHHHPSSTDISPDEDQKTKHETVTVRETTTATESRSSAVKSAMKLRALMWKLKKSKGDGTEKIEFDDSVLTTANQMQRKLMTAELRVKEKYIEKVKPMYIGVSKRYKEKKVRLAAQLRVKSPRETRSGQSPPSKSYTRKSTADKRRSREHEMTEAPPLPVVLKNWKQGNLPARLRSAILHCKRSFNGSRDSESSENCSEEPEETGTGDGPEAEVEMRL